MTDNSLPPSATDNCLCCKGTCDCEHGCIHPHSSFLDMSKEDFEDQAKQLVLEKVREACPWTKDLKFGCKFLYEYHFIDACKKRHERQGIATVFGYESLQGYKTLLHFRFYNYFADVMENKSIFLSKEEKKQLEIIGSDLQLHHLQHTLYLKKLVGYDYEWFIERGFDQKKSLNEQYPKLFLQLLPLFEL